MLSFGTDSGELVIAIRPFLLRVYDTLTFPSDTNLCCTVVLEIKAAVDDTALVSYYGVDGVSLADGHAFNGPRVIANAPHGQPCVDSARDGVCDKQLRCLLEPGLTRFGLV